MIICDHINQSIQEEHVDTMAWTYSNIARHKPLKFTEEQLISLIKTAKLFLNHPNSNVHSKLFLLSFIK